MKLRKIADEGVFSFFENLSIKVVSKVDKEIVQTIDNRLKIETD